MVNLLDEEALREFLKFAHKNSQGNTLELRAKAAELIRTRLLKYYVPWKIRELYTHLLRWQAAGDAVLSLQSTSMTRSHATWENEMQLSRVVNW